MKFVKEMLDRLEYVELGLENCECFKIAGADVLDFWTSEIKKSRRADIYHAEDGGLIISKNAFNVLSSFAPSLEEMATEGIDYDPYALYYLHDRLTTSCDICTIEFKLKGEESVLFYVPYDPLEDHAHGTEIDMSNCPSAEIDENGDMLILFGESSHTFKRVDNNYSDLIIGLNDQIEQPINGEMLALFDWFLSKEWPSRCPRLIIDVVIKYGKFGDKKIMLVFEDVREAYYELRFHNKNRHIWMSRVAADKIYVEFEDFVQFYCSAIKTYDAYLNRIDGNDDLQSDEMCKMAIDCLLSDEQMRLLAANDSINYETNFSSAEFVAAKEKALSGVISATYFQYWVQVYSNMIENYQCRRLKFNKFYDGILVLLDRLQIKLSYADDVAFCTRLIADSADEIEKFYSENCPKS